MKKIAKLLPLVIGSFMTLSCEEIPPKITPC